MLKLHSLEVGLLRMGHTSMGIKMAMLYGRWSSQKTVNTWQPVGKITSFESGQSYLRRKSDKRMRKKRMLRRRQARVFD